MYGFSLSEKLNGIIVNLTRRTYEKKCLILALICVIYTEGAFAQQTNEAQNSAVEKAISGIQLGESGLVYYYEFKLDRKITLRAEAGVSLGFFPGEYGLYSDEDEMRSVAVIPVLAAEPRWYYNLERRVRKSKDISRNRANYLSLYTACSGGWGAVKLDNKIDKVPGAFAIAPMWGMRRTIGQHFNYELGAGVGYSYTGKFDHLDHHHKTDSDIFLFVRARFGFDF